MNRGPPRASAGERRCEERECGPGELSAPRPDAQRLVEVEERIVRLETRVDVAQRIGSADGQESFVLHEVPSGMSRAIAAAGGICTARAGRFSEGGVSKWT